MDQDDRDITTEQRFTHTPGHGLSAERALSIPQMLELRAAQTAAGAAAAAIVAPGRDPLTYGGLWSQIGSLARSLRAMGLGRRDRVAVVLPNGPEMAVAFVAIASGATVAPLNPAYGRDEFHRCLSDLQAGALVISADMDSPAREAARALNVLTIDLLSAPQAHTIDIRLQLADQNSSPRPDLAGPDDIAMVLQTSGTTARPKTVPLTHAALCASALDIQTAFALTPDDCCLNVMPLFHVHGLVGAVLSTLASGGRVVCPPRFDPPSFFQWLADFAPTWYTAVPTIHQAIVSEAAFRPKVSVKPSLRFIRSCSAPLPPRVMGELERTFAAPVLESYGMTEAAHQISSNPLPPRQRKPGSVGVATGPEVAIMDEGGDLLPTGETGEIVLRGAHVIGSYENAPKANQRAFHRGWFKTGDQGRIDSDGYIFITGRMKELINRGGEKVAPREVEDALLQHPAVAEAVAFAVPHPTLGEHVAAAVVLRPGAATTEAELRRTAFAHLADHKVPSQVIIVDVIPKGPTGKLQRVGLAEEFGPALQPAFVAPRGPAEEGLAAIWAGVLNLERVGARDNFFSLGGDSLSATRVVSRVDEFFQVDLPLTQVFRDPTLAGQALYVEDAILRQIEGLADEQAHALASSSERTGGDQP